MPKILRFTMVLTQSSLPSRLGLQWDPLQVLQGRCQHLLKPNRRVRARSAAPERVAAGKPRARSWKKDRAGQSAQFVLLRSRMVVESLPPQVSHRERAPVGATVSRFGF